MKKKPMPPIKAIKIDNRELEQLLAAHKDANTGETLQNFAEKLRVSPCFALAIPVAPGKAGYMILKNPEGKSVLPIFTSNSRLEKMLQVNKDAMKRPPLQIVKSFADFAAEWGKDPANTIVLNPYDENLTITNPMLRLIAEGEAEYKKTGERKPLDFKLSRPIPIDNSKVDAAAVEYLSKSDRRERAEAFRALFEALKGANLIIPNRPTADVGKVSPEIIRFEQTGDLFIKVLSGYDVEPAEKDQKPKQFLIRRWEELLTLFETIPDEVKGILLVTENAKVPIVRELMHYAKTGEMPAGAAGQDEDAIPGFPDGMPQIPQETLEHIRFEAEYLPTRFFEEGKKLFDEIAEKREEAVDALFEASYTDIRMYPYLPEDFSVMALTVGEGREIVQIEFPAKDQGAGAITTAVLSWDETKNAGRYFSFLKAADGVRSVMEVFADGDAKTVGEAPAEGSEIRYIVELLEQ